VEIFAQPPVIGDRLQAQQTAAGSVGAKALDVEDGAVALGEAVDEAEHHLSVGGPAPPLFKARMFSPQLG
jgi:hypothetical protein